MAFKKWLEQKQNIILYRSAMNLMQPGGFWTPDMEYVKYIRPKGEIYRATLSSSAKITRINTQANRQDMLKAKSEGYDVIVFPAWDWETDEYVVLNVGVLTNVLRLSQRPT